MLFPETDQNPYASYIAKSKVFHGRNAKRDWSITCSAGVLTCTVAPNIADELIRMADDLMYSANIRRILADKLSIKHGFHR